ncbi:unnamed protein product [Cyprideis torosa]|uniref:Uncharacterized protein n=1 Tax=Cyprideis torosa TaxID=163714 RepID=A0A7R8ZKJ3_9CRUS|nr:unnamed protein product [Cyprideis torosa]CAG0880358.1 unnamed protein product [Cyprideis torosa]
MDKITCENGCGIELVRKDAASHDCIKDLRDTVEDLRDTVEDLRDTVEDLRDTVEDLRDTVEDLRDTVEDLRGTVQDLRDTVEDPRDTVEDFRQHCLNSKASFCLSLASASYPHHGVVTKHVVPVVSKHVVPVVSKHVVPVVSKHVVETKAYGGEAADVKLDQDNHQFSYKVSQRNYGPHHGYGHGSSSFQYHSQAQIPVVHKTYGYGDHGAYGHGHHGYKHAVHYEQPYKFGYGYGAHAPKVYKSRHVETHVKPVVHTYVKPVVHTAVKPVVYKTHSYGLTHGPHRYGYGHH